MSVPVAQPDTAPRSLFTERVRIPGDRLPYSASLYERLDASGWERSERERALLDRWYHELPAHAKREIASRFTSPLLGQHLGAFFELYMFASARGDGFDVEVDIGRDDCAARNPDFLFEKAGYGIGVEATVALGDDSVDRDERARVQQLYDAIERIPTRDFLLHLKLRAVGPATPGKKTIIRPLDQWLRGLDYDEVLAGAARPSTTIDRDGWTIDVEASACKPHLRAMPDHGIIGTFVEGFGLNRYGLDTWRSIDEVKPLAKALIDKADHRYEIHQRPFVVAGLCSGTFVEEHDIVEALLGPGRPGHRPGLWFGGRHSTVSAVVTVANLTPTGIAVVEPTVWLNPHGKRPLDPELLPWQWVELGQHGVAAKHPARRTAADVLGLPPGWPARVA